MRRFILTLLLLGAAAKNANAQAAPSSLARTWGIEVAPATLVQTRTLAGNDTPVAGGGLAVEIARALPWTGRGFGSSAFLAASAGTIGNDGDSYDASAISIGLRVPLVARTRQWRPYVQAGLGVRFAQTQSADGLESRRVESWSTAAVVGIGQHVRIRGQWSLDVGLRVEAGPWAAWRRDDGSRPPNEATAVGTLRAASGAFLLGIRWGH